MTDTSRTGSPPPFDPELLPALESLARVIPPAVLPEMLPGLRAFMASSAATDDDVRRGGAVEFAECHVPGPTGAPDISLPIRRPTGSTGPLPAVYFTYGGGMVPGDDRNLIGEMLDWVRHLGVVLVTVEYRLAPEHPFPPVWRTCTPVQVDHDTRRRAGGRPPSRGGVGTECGRWSDGGRDPARTGSGRSCCGGPVAGLPGARRPQRQRLRPPDGRRGGLGPHLP